VARSSLRFIDYFQVIADKLVALAARYRIPAYTNGANFVVAGVDELQREPRRSRTDRRRIRRPHPERRVPGRFAGRAIIALRAGYQPEDRESLGLIVPQSLFARAVEVIE